MNKKEGRRRRHQPDKSVVVYIGTRSVLGAIVRRKSGRSIHNLPTRVDLICYSPDFSWGYGGAGPSQLALALCCAVLKNDALALQVHDEFKWRVIVNIKENKWQMTEQEINRQIEEIIHGL